MDKALKFSQRQCISALICSAIVIVSVCIGVTINLTNIIDISFDYNGIRTFCMFTVNSNILAAIAMMMVFPFALDGLRKNNYHLPNWIVVLLYMATTSVALTFLVSLFLLLPVKGFAFIFLGSGFFLHAVCPILTILSFCLFISDHRISFKKSFLALIPVFIYACVYFVMVVVLGPEKGGWEDFYGFATKVPLALSITAVMPITYLIATGLRLAHNALYKHRKMREAALYREEYEGADVRSIIEGAGRSRALTQRIRDIVVPVRVIEIVVRNSDCSVDEGCRIFLDAYIDEMRKREAMSKNESKKNYSDGCVLTRLQSKTQGQSEDD